jgi:hypothetical protein
MEQLILGALVGWLGAYKVSQTHYPDDIFGLTAFKERGAYP